MKILVIGAGASVEEAKRLGISENQQPPLVGNFAKRLWSNSLPKSLILFIKGFLRENHYKLWENPLEQFLYLEKLRPELINVERLFEYSWHHRNKYYENAWHDLLYHGIVNPLVMLFASNGFHENGVGWKPFKAYQAAASNMAPGDLVVNLNYEPLFEMASLQIQREFTYSPNEPSLSEFLVSKPHGSINLIVEDEKFWFAQADIIGSQMLLTEDKKFFRGIIPPRYNKSYDQHPISHKLFNAIKQFKPEKVTFWGIGFTGSDKDLASLYKIWSTSAKSIELIHPDSHAPSINYAKNFFGRNIELFNSPEEWASN